MKRVHKQRILMKHANRNEVILVIDDDVELCELVTEYLTSESFSVDVVHDGEEGVEKALAEHAEEVPVETRGELEQAMEKLRTEIHGGTATTLEPAIDGLSSMCAPAGFTIDNGKCRGFDSPPQ